MTKMTILAGAAFLIGANVAHAGDTFRYQDGTALSPTEFLIHSNPELYPDRARLNQRNPTGQATVPADARAPGARTQHWMSNPGISNGSNR